MEWVKLVVELIGHLAWPVAIFILVWLFRGQVRALLRPEDVDSIEAGPGGIKLNRRRIEEELSAARSAIGADDPQLDDRESAPPEHVERMQKISEIDPPVAVFASAAHFESTLRSRLAELDLLPTDPRRRVLGMQGLLAVAGRSGLLTKSQARGAARLNQMRNEIAHEYGYVDMDAAQAMEFCQLAWELEDDIISSQPRRI